MRLIILSPMLAVLVLLWCVDRHVDRVTIQFTDSIRGNPFDQLAIKAQPAWLGPPRIDSIRDTTTIKDRLFFRRRLTVDYTTMRGGKQLSYTVIKCNSTFIIDPCYKSLVGHMETPTFTFY